MTAPIAPSNLTATADGPVIIRLAWQDNSSDEDNFELERSPNGVSSWVQIDTPAANAVAYVDSGLTANTTYYYRLRAVNGSGNSDYTAVASATTKVAPGKPFAPRLYILQAEVVFAAQVNLVVPFYPLDEIPYDNVTTGAYTDIEANMTVLIGTTPGADDLGSQRIRKACTADTIYVGRCSRGTRPGQLTPTNDAYITVLWEYLPWAKMPAVGSDGTVYKDSDVPVGTYTTNPPPVAVAQASFAATIDPSTEVITVLLNGQASFATADGATIASYAWAIHDATLVSGTLTDDNITITCPAGYRYIDLTVVDSNDTPHTTHRLIYARDPEDDDSVAVEITSHHIDERGQRVTVRPLTNIPASSYRENAPCLLWEREPSGSSDRDHMLIVGYLQDEPQSIQAGRGGNQRDATLQILDIAGKLDVLPGLPQSLTNDDFRDTEVVPAITWEYMTDPTLDKYIHYLLLWHSTALEIADFAWTGTEDLYTFVLLTSDGGSLWAQVAQRARQFLPDYCLTCDRRGRIALVPDPMVRDSGDRTSTVLAAIDGSEYSSLRVTVQKWPRIHWLRASALLAGLADPVEIIFSLAPGETPGQGVGATTQGEQLALSQDALNAVTGHREARINAPYGHVYLTLVQNDTGNAASVPWREIEPAYKQWVTLTLAAADAAQRGLTFTTARCLPVALDIKYDHRREGTPRTIELELELETSGEPGVTVTKPTIPGVGETPTPTPAPAAPDLGLVEGQEMVAGFGRDGYLYRTLDFQTASGSGGPTWTQHDLSITDVTLFSFVVDPFSPGYVDGAGAINAWVVGETDIWRVTDIFGTPAAASCHTFATPISASSVFVSRTIGASFGRYFPTDSDNPWLLCISHYGNSSSHSGTWATYSVDGGATWASEVQITEHYDIDVSGNDPANIPALWMSPRTPGLAYTAAYTETYSPARASGYQTTDWGATWTPMVTAADDDAIERQVLWHAWQDDTTLLETHVGARANLSAVISTTGPSVSASFDVNMRPPEAAVRVDVTVKWSWTYIKTGGFSNPSASITQTEPTFVNDLDTHNFSSPSTPGTTSGTFDESFQVTNLPRDFPGNREAAEATPPTATTTSAVRWRALVNASATGGNTVGVAIQLSLEVTEIELADGTIYTPPLDAPAIINPVQRLGGDVHVPWEGNADEAITFFASLTRSGTLDYQLFRTEADGETMTDITPTISGRDYGLNAYGFRVRAHDSDADLVLAGVTGNGASADTDDNYQAVVLSEDGGDTWAAIVAATNSTEPYAAAWAGDSTQIIYLYGPPEYVAYSANRGTSVDDRSGNLSSFSPAALIGICGGPTG